MYVRWKRGDPQQNYKKCFLKLRPERRWLSTVTAGMQIHSSRFTAIRSWRSHSREIKVVGAREDQEPAGAVNEDILHLQVSDLTS